MLDKLILLYNWIWGIPMICIRAMPVGRNAGENRRTLELNFEKKGVMRKCSVFFIKPSTR